nr:hypothetical protein [Allobaculum sp. Allo2]
MYSMEKKEKSRPEPVRAFWRWSKSGYLPERAEVLLGRNPSKMIGLIVHDHPEYEGLP